MDKESREAGAKIVRIKLQQAEAKLEFERKKLELDHEATMERLNAEMELSRLEEHEPYQSSITNATAYQEVPLTPIRQDSQNMAMHGFQATPTLNPYAAEFHLTEPQQPIETSMTEAYRTMASAIRETVHMPKPEIMPFSGDPCEYFRFSHMFNTNIDKRVEDNCTKLAYLVQFCQGEAKEAIKDCVVLPPNSGYDTAKNILKAKYGRPHVIARAYLQQILSGPAIKSNEAEGITKLATLMKRCLITLQELKYTADLNSTDNLLKIVRRLPIHLRAKWAEKADSYIERGAEPTFENLTDFIETRARVAGTLYGQELARINSQEPPKKDMNVHKPRGTTLATQSSNTPKPRCWHCNSDHWLQDCKLFKKMAYSDRRALTRGKGLCDNCLQRHHRSRDCRMNSQCTVAGCTWKHCTLLHPQQVSTPTASMTPAPAPPPAPPVREPTIATTTGKATSNATNTGGRVCLRVVPVQVTAGNITKHTYALLDDCSDVSLCKSELVNELGATTTKTSYSLTTVNKESNTINGAEVNLSIMSLDGAEKIDMEKVLTIEKIPISPSSIPLQSDLQKWPHLQDLSFPSINESEITVLIGSDVPEAFWQLDERRGKRGEPYAVKSLLGWTVIGPVRPGTADRKCVNFIQCDDTSLERKLEQFWKHDFCDVTMTKDSMSQEDKRALKQMEDSAQLIDGHYTISLPWRRGPENLVNNRKHAESRANMLKRRLTKDDKLRQKYCGEIEKYIQKGYATKVKMKHQEPVWYIPHHAVINPKKPEKVRVVFDCAAEYKGRSLNKELLQGPDLTNSLIGVLLRFRQGAVAMAADVEAMFHQVRVPPTDYDVLRFLWWENGLDDELVDYQMTVHIFGATSSPSVCAYALKKTADDNKDLYDQQTIDVVYNNFYVDDCLVSVDTEEEAKRISTQLISLLKRGGFNLRKWKTNKPKALADLPEDAKASSAKSLELEPMERTLGIQWNIDDDVFVIYNEVKDQPHTRRGILSVLSSVYDPLGFVAPVILQAKLILQRLCKDKLSWDEVADDDTQRKWVKWLSHIDELKQTSVSRPYNPQGFPVRKIEIHNFADASQEAYGAVSYLRVIGEDEVHCAFLMGKSRLAPLKSVTIPRLELMAAVIAVRLNKLLHEQLQLQISDTYFWSDSTAVLQYIRNETRRFKTFVANRLAEIHESTVPSQWMHVPGTLNPADIASRGLDPTDHYGLQTWLKGPQFMWMSKDSWPLQPDNLPPLETDELKDESKVAFMVSKNDPIDDFITRHSTWIALLRATAWILRIKSHLRRKHKEKHTTSTTSAYLLVKDINEAKQALLVYVQRRAYPDEVAEIRKGRTVKTGSCLRKLSPFLQDGVLRVGGRIERAPLPFDARHPAILPQSHHLTKLVVLAAHVDSGHVGVNHVLASTRREFWIPHGKTAVKKIIGRCLLSKIRTAPPGEQLMAPLPKDRITPFKPPFTFVGVDYFGPMLVKQGRSQVKRYGCLFTCLTSRAIHVEIAHSLDTDSFLGALFRFISRRGRPEKIYSDNGTNFKAGERELRESLTEWNQNRIHEKLLQRNIQWHFNPPAASHMGGVWERMVRSVKTILKGLLKEQLVKDETLSTLMAEVEKILNDRPLTAVSDDARDLEPLTPNTLLLLRQNTCTPPGEYKDSRSIMNSKRWFAQAQYLADIFWRRWIHEYLPTLQNRQKWLKQQRNFKISDLVVVIDDSLPRGQWPLGRVIETRSDDAGLVRSVKIQTGTSIKERPITKVCFLEEEIQEEPSVRDVENEAQDSELDSRA